MSARLCAVLALSAATACMRLHACASQEEWPGPKGPPPPAQRAAPAASGPVLSLDVARPHGTHPRILLTPARLTALRALRDAGKPSWRRLADKCDEFAGQPIDSGYEAWDWVNAALDLGMCDAVSSRPDYARAALRYFRAVLDDRYKVGDGAGGDDVVHHDDGYSIRTHGCFGAIAYDWLHDAPGMTDELRKHAVDRFVAWNKWFGESGYNRDQPIANYFMGYFGAVAFGGIAAQGDDPRAGELLKHAQHMFSSGVVPTYTQKLGGGDFPEGWQYGDMVGAILAIFADTEARPDAARSPYDELPWLKQIVQFRTHALWPDGRHTLDTGDWSEKPAVAPTHALMALATVLPAADETQRRARALARLASDPKSEEWAWLAALSDDPSRLAEDPRRGSTSYLSPGTGTVTARTSWSPGAVWFALASAPSLSDHQHLDAGHFEIVRGGDSLIVDAGGYGSYSSLSHNVIAVDDRKENDNYCPNQGTWSDSAKVARHYDDGRFVYALADYASAYDPAGYPVDHPQRSVSRAEREVVFSRSPVPGAGAESARVVVYDRITLSKPSYGATFLLHGAGTPVVEGGSARFGAGQSAVFATTLLPQGVAPVVVAEPTPLGDGPYYANDPPEGKKSVRIEVRSKPGQLERRFLHAFVAAGADARPPTALLIDGGAVDGVVLGEEAYVFEHAGPQVHPATVDYRAPASAVRHVVASLAPHGRYTVGVQRDGDACHVSLTPGDGVTASDAGVIVLDFGAGCTIAPLSRTGGPAGANGT